MNKAEFVAEVARKASITRAEAARAVDAVFDAEYGAISKALDEAGELSIRGFGQFTKQRAFTDRSMSVETVAFRPWLGRQTLIFETKEYSRLWGAAVRAEDPQPAATERGVRSNERAAEEELRSLAVGVWENPADAEEFLITPHGLLEGQTPLAASRTAEGAKRVREILLALEYGLPV
jgi:DNA-binding protein HU-beta